MNKAEKIWSALKKHYPKTPLPLRHRSAFELLVATILSAQCTDEQVNAVTPRLFAVYPKPKALAKAVHGELEKLVYSTGFYRTKARHLIAMAKILVKRYQGRVPESMPELLELPGVARKTANVVLSGYFKKHEGIVVDTHVIRLTRRLGLVQAKNPVQIEQELMVLIPKPDWAHFSLALIYHGRALCRARNPRCVECFLLSLCPSGIILKPPKN
jgi:endonuclease-3